MTNRLNGMVSFFAVNDVYGTSRKLQLALVGLASRELIFFSCFMSTNQPPSNFFFYVHMKSLFCVRTCLAWPSFNYAPKEQAFFFWFSNFMVSQGPGL